MSNFPASYWEGQVSLDSLIRSDAIELGRGNVISKKDIRSNPGLFPIYSSSAKKNGKMGEYGEYMFDEELISWSVDGGGNFFHRQKHKFSVTNVSGYMRKHSDQIDYKFLFFILDFQHEFISFDYQTKAHPSVIRDIYWIPVIPLPEQQKIASILTSVDEVIEKTQSQINKLQDLKKGTMNELLTKGIGHTEFKDSPVGKIPVGWDFVYISDVAKIGTGNKDTKDKEDNGIYPFFVRSQTVERINSYSYDGETILTAGDGVGTGKVFHYINGKFDFHQRVYKLSDFSSKISGRFLFEYFRLNFISQVNKYSAKGSVDSVRMEMISKMWIPLPTLEEQLKIAKSLLSIETTIEEKQRKLEQTQSLKKSLMQDLLTGKVRVTVN